MELARYCSRWQQLLKLEHKAQSNILNNRLSNMNVIDLQRQGYCITDVKLQIKGVFYGDRIGRLSLKENQTFPINHQFNDGNQIMLSRDHPLSSSYPVLKGSILERNKRYIDIVLYQNAFQQSNKMNEIDSRMSSGFWRIDIGVDEQTINRMQYALNIFNDEMKYNGSKLLQKMISKNYNDSSTLMMIDQEEVIKYNPKYFQKPEQNTKQTKYNLKNPEISKFKNFLTEQLLLNINNHLNEIKHESCSLFKDLQIEIQQLLQESELSLNKSQMNAVKSSFQNVITLIQGPPGTGKTRTAVELIYFASKLQQLTQKYYNKLTNRKRKNTNIGKPILATAYTNAGIDQLLSELLDKGLKVVRIGLPVRMNSNVRSVCLPSYIENHPKQKEIIKIENCIKELNEQLSEIRKKYTQMSTTTPAITRLRKNRREKLFKEKQKLLLKKEEISNNIINDILSSSDVVCATCVGCGNDVFINSKSLQFSLIIIDEASQLIEPALLIPLIYSCSKYGRLVLIGDQKQLPPLIMSQEAKKHGLDITLFDRLIDAFTTTKYLSHIPLFTNNLLSMQYRMHPDISQWPNSVVYNNQIKNASSALKLQAFEIPGFIWPSKKIYDDTNDKTSKYFFENNSPLIFIDVDGKEFKRRSDLSVNNEAEANVIVKILRNIIEENVNNNNFDEILSSIGIITGYNAQVTLITDKLSDIYGKNNTSLDCIDIDSVDGFQGREKDLIILSCVRSNKQNDIGFMKDDRRLNVALTRARRGLIIIGNANTLSHSDKLWNNFISFMRNSGRIVSDKNIMQYLQKNLNDTQSTQEINNLYLDPIIDDTSHTTRHNKVIEAIVAS